MAAADKALGLENFNRLPHGRTGHAEAGRKVIDGGKLLSQHPGAALDLATQAVRDLGVKRHGMAAGMGREHHAIRRCGYILPII